MSDTIDEAGEVQPETDPNFSVARVTVNLNGKDSPGMRFTFGAPQRTITTRDLSLSNQFDLVEVAGDQASNATWMMMASLAYATTDIDGVPTPPPTKRAHIRSVLDQIKPEGLSAYFKALRTVKEPDGAVVSAAKNF